MNIKLSELLCRVCLQEDELLVYIYEVVEEFQVDLSILLQSCSDLKIDKTDALPKYLCRECTNELLITAKFRKKCAETQQQLCQMEASLKEAQKNVTSLETENICTVNSETVTNFIDQSKENDILETVQEEATVEEDVIVFDPEDIDMQHMETVVTEPKDPQDLEYINEEAQLNVLLQEAINPENIEHCTEAVIPANIEHGTQDLMNITTAAVEDNVQQTEAQQKTTTINDLEAIIAEAASKTQLVTNFTCDLCGAAFIHKHSLQRHVDSLHKTVASSEKESTAPTNVPERLSNSLRCNYCDKQFRAQFALDMHTRTHTGERPFVCGVCTKTFKTKSALDSHTRLHTGLQKYKCSFCEKTFADGSNMRRHMASHTGEKPHSCTICDKRFARVYLLQLHMRTHTGEKPYQCSNCSQSFTQLSSLRSHEQMHIGPLYECTLCQKHFTRRSHLLHHAEQKHANLVINSEAMLVEEHNAAEALITEVRKIETENNLDYNWTLQ